MRKLAIGGVGLMFLLLASPAKAQDGGTAVEFGIGGGLAIPTGDFGDFAKTGFDAMALVSIVPATMPVGFQIDGNFSRFSDDTPLDIKSQIIYGTGNVVYNFQTAEGSRFRPYLIGGGGVYNLDAKGEDAIGGSTTKFGINAGAGFNFSAGSAGLFLEGRFHTVFTEGSNTSFIPINIGVRFGGRGA